MILVGLTMTSFSDKMLISNRCLRGLMPNLIKKSVMVFILHRRTAVDCVVKSCEALLLYQLVVDLQTFANISAQDVTFNEVTRRNNRVSFWQYLLTFICIMCKVCKNNSTKRGCCKNNSSKRETIELLQYHTEPTEGLKIGELNSK